MIIISLFGIRCTQRDCMIPLNRDRNGASNIATNFKRLFEGHAPIRTMGEEDFAFPPRFVPF